MPQPPPPVEAEYLALLRRFDTPTVCNVIELFDVRPRNEGFLDSRIRAIYPHLPPIVGYATTATFRSAGKRPEGDGYSSLGDQVERFLETIPEPRIVVFQDLDTPPHGATYGEVMCTIYKSFGCQGLVTSGAARDIEQVGRLAFPCFASAVAPSHSYNRILDVNVPVEVGGVTVHPGDVLHADANGVTTIPSTLVREVALACQPLVDAENDAMHALADRPTAAILKEAMARSATSMAEIAAAARAEVKRRH